MRLIPLRLWLFAACSAVLQVLPFPIAGPVPAWRRLFCWICLAPLLLALNGRDKNGQQLRPFQSAILGYASGVLWYLGNCYWIFQTMHTYGELPRLASYGILLLFSLYVALYHALFGYVFGLLRRRFSSSAVLALTPFLWAAVELARSRVTGFPWDLLGYTLVDNVWVNRLAGLTGVLGLSFVVAATNALWIVRLRHKSRELLYAGPVAALVLLTGISLAGARSPMAPLEEPTDTALLLQENLSVGADATGPPETKQQLLNAFSGLSLQRPDSVMTPMTGHPLPTALLSAKPRIIAWPEAPADFFDGDIEFRKSIAGLARAANTPVIVNDVTLAARTPDGHRHLYNSAAFFLADGSYAGRYDKMRLVPFGEYTPFAPLFFFAGHLLGDLPFLPGLERRIFTADSKRYGVFICYESIFGDDIRRFALDGAEVLVNISDDGWYGDSSAPWEHLDMVRMRAVENARWIVRATNTGITAAIDSRGRVRQSIPRHVRGSLLAGFAFRDSTTFYTRHGDWLGWLCVVTVLGAVLWALLPLKQVH